MLLTCNLFFEDSTRTRISFERSSVERHLTLQGHLAIGHTRYSTTGGSRWENAQPAFKTNAGQVGQQHMANHAPGPHAGDDQRC